MDILADKFNSIIQEQDKETRDRMIDALTESEAKELLRSFADFKHREPQFST